MTLEPGAMHQRHLAGSARAIVEVKRASAGKALIDQDLRRLALARASNVTVRGFLILVSEAKQPARFVSDGKSRLGRFALPGMPGWHFRVRRTTKAAASYTALKAQHYICMLEVFRDTAN